VFIDFAKGIRPFRPEVLILLKAFMQLYSKSANALSKTNADIQNTRTPPGKTIGQIQNMQITLAQSMKISRIRECPEQNLGL
jgi:hypothetical protein